MIDTTRHKGFIEKINLDEPITIVGCGSLGTVAATTLARIGFKNFTLIDDDIVEEHNIANQYFEQADIGKAKVNALKDKMLLINPDARITAIQDFYVAKAFYELTHSVFILPDNMLVRKLIMEHRPNDSLVIDARMGGLNGSVFGYRGLGGEEYAKTLFDDDKAVELPCTAKSIIYTVATVANLAVSVYMRMLGNSQVLYSSYAINLQNGIDVINTGYMEKK